MLKVSKGHRVNHIEKFINFLYEELMVGTAAVLMNKYRCTYSHLEVVGLGLEGVDGSHHGRSKLGHDNCVLAQRVGLYGLTIGARVSGRRNGSRRL